MTRTSTSIDPLVLVVAFHAAINALDFDRIEAFFADDATYVSGKVGGLKGRDDIMTAFRRYFAEYPDQIAIDSLVETVSPMAARSVWSLAATSASKGTPLVRNGEETITFNDQGLVVRVDVTDY